MKVLRMLKNTIEMGDFFYSTQMLRFQKEGEYRTLTGGILSIGIIITIVIGFTSMIGQTLNKSSFTTSLTVEKKPDPSATLMTASPDRMFMFGIEIWRHNLNEGKRYFDIKAMLYTEEYGWAVTTDLTLVPCTREHWTSFPDIVQKFETLQVNYWMCPPIGASYEIYGKYTAEHYKQVAFYVYPCNNATNPDRLCAPQSEIDAYFDSNSHNFFFTFYFINPVVNPSNTDYIQYYLEDKNYVQFGSQQSCEAYLYITDFTIHSDNSILPFESQKVDKGFLANDLAVNHPYQYAVGGAYAGIYLAKSSDSFIYHRVVQKISEVFSFIGGIIGAVSAFLFIIGLYTDFSYEAMIASTIFKSQNQMDSEESAEESQSKKEEKQSLVNSNFLKFCKYGVYETLKTLGQNVEWQEMRELKQFRDEIVMQLDVPSIIKRLIFLEHSLTYILEDYQLAGLQLKRPVTAHQIKKLRQRCNLLEQMDSSSSSSQGQSPCNIDPAQQKGAEGKGQASLQRLSVSSLHPDGLSGEIMDMQPTGFENTYKKLLKKKDEVINPTSNLDGLEKELQKQRRVSLDNHFQGFNIDFKAARQKRASKRKTYIRHLEQSVAEGNLVSIKIWKTLNENHNKDLDDKIGPGRKSIQLYNKKGIDEIKSQNSHQ